MDGVDLAIKKEIELVSEKIVRIVELNQCKKAKKCLVKAIIQLDNAISFIIES